MRLRQILDNLLVNAVKFSSRPDQSGDVALRVELIDESQVRFVVIDNGIGMTPEVQAELFKPFAQGETSTTRCFGGTGLGLSICQLLTEQFAGRIEVDSTPGKGSTFTVTLPVELEVNSPPRPVSPDLANLNCLVVARDVRRARDWCVYLEHAGARAEALPDRRMAQRRLEQNPSEGTVLVAEEDWWSIQRWRDDLALDAPITLVAVGSGRRQKPRLKNPGIAAVDGDPISREGLLLAVELATGRAQPDPDADVAQGSVNEKPFIPGQQSATAQAQLILVAEDNGVNQKVIRRQLALLGYTAEVAENGREALTMWRKGKYDLLMTDLDMPEMDGYALTAAIRKEEGDLPHLPIVALTANALKEDAKRCREAGMDDYISKPVVLEKLQAMLDKWLSNPAGATAPPTWADGILSEAAPAKVTLDKSVLVRLVGDDAALIAELMQDFLRSLEAGKTQLSQAIATADWAPAGAVAHRLKSSSRAVGALALGECCERLERAGKAGDGAAVDKMIAKFEVAVSGVIAAVADSYGEFGAFTR